MKILLVKPYFISDHIQPPLGLGYLATALRPVHEVALLDCLKENVPPEAFMRRLEEFSPDVVGVQCYTLDLAAVKELLAACRRFNPRIVTLVGGPHPSSVPAETMRHFGDALDFAFAGEAERGMTMLCARLRDGSDDYGSVPGLVWRRGGEIVVNQKHVEEDLDSLGFPAWDLIRPETYPESQHGAFFVNFPIAPVILTRGCPYKCSFCAGYLVSSRRFRKRSVPHVMREITMLYRERGIREFHIIDDNFTLDIAYAKSFLEALRDSGLTISWALPNGIRLDRLDEEVLRLMKSTGLYLVSLGIESGSDRVLGMMQKGFTVAQVVDKVALIRRVGIDVAGFFMLGYPTETVEEMRQTIRLSLDLGLVRANYFTFLPFPGTDSYNLVREEGGLDRVDWDKFLFMNAAYTPRGVTRAQLKRIQRLAFMRFYLRPSVFIKNVRCIQSWRHLVFLLRRFYHWLIMK
jgi:radical SAM superfamily enzyme YgiQ (UPF0313 family)